MGRRTYSPEQIINKLRKVRFLGIDNAPKQNYTQDLLYEIS